MIINFSIGTRSYRANLSQPRDISIPLHFNGAQPSHFGAPPASAHPLKTDNFIGSVASGGSCNVGEYRLVPHCNGTHTECVGHITREQISIHEQLLENVFPATLISVSPVPEEETPESYLPPKEPGDMLITAAELKQRLSGQDSSYLTALIVRTLPNDSEKSRRNYLQIPPPFFSCEAMQFINQLPVQHLLVDVPSVDRMFDEGRMTNHRQFWNIKPGSQDTSEETFFHKTITEMVFVSNDIPDGKYLVQIQIPNFMADAAPSRVFLFKLE